MNFTLLVVVLLTAIAFVGIVIALSNAIAPRSYNAQKMEPYECGIPTRGKSWMQFRVGYYLFAILFLMFDVETVFLFPWAVIARDLGIAGLLSILFFLLILVLGLGCPLMRLGGNLRQVRLQNGPNNMTLHVWSIRQVVEIIILAVICLICIIIRGRKCICMMHNVLRY